MPFEIPSNASFSVIYPKVMNNTILSVTIPEILLIIFLAFMTNS